MFIKALIAPVENLMTRFGSQQQSSQDDIRTNIFTMEEVNVHCHQNDCWLVISDKVYDVTTFLNEHPGGRDIVIEYAGRDATLAYKGVGHAKIEELLETFRIGELTNNERMWPEHSMTTCAKSSPDEMQ